MKQRWGGGRERKRDGEVSKVNERICNEAVPLKGHHQVSIKGASASSRWPRCGLCGSLRASECCKALEPFSYHDRN
jgi:hypothetical protein